MLGLFMIAAPDRGEQQQQLLMFLCLCFVQLELKSSTSEHTTCIRSWPGGQCGGQLLASLLLFLAKPEMYFKNRRIEIIIATATDSKGALFFHHCCQGILEGGPRVARLGQQFYISGLLFSRSPGSSGCNRRTTSAICCLLSAKKMALITVLTC